MRPRRHDNNSQKYPKAQRKRHNDFLFSPTEVWRNKTPEEREFVVDSGASKGLWKSDDGCYRQWRSATNDEATVYVKEMDFFVTVKIRRYTSSSLTWKTLRRSRIFIWVDQWSKTTSHWRWQTNTMQHGKLRTDRCPWFIDQFFQFSYTYISTIVTAGFCGLYIASRNNTQREYRVAKHGETCRQNQQKPKQQTKMRTSSQHGETCCVICQNG